MRYIRPITLCCTGIFAASALSVSGADALGRRPAHPVPSWYLALSASTNFVSDANLSENLSGALSSTEVSYDQGYGFAGAIGYRPRNTNTFYDNMRFEVELGMNDNDISRSTNPAVGTGVFSSDIQAQRFMANAYVDLSEGSPIRPYIGGGIGIARLHGETDEDTSLAYQAMAGISYTPAEFPVLEFHSGYRYFTSQDAEFTDTSTGSLVDIEYETHMLEAGIRAYF